MLEACIDTFAHPPTSPEQRGDIVVLALAGHPWGVEELGVLQIVQVDDPMLEAELLMMKDASARLMSTSLHDGFRASA